MLALQYKNSRKEQHDQSNSSNSVKDVRDAHRVDPGYEGEDEDRAESVAGERKTYEGIADDLYINISILCFRRQPGVCDEPRCRSL